MKDHLWIWGSYGISDIKNLLGVTGQVDHTKLDDTNVKLNFQAGGNSGSLLYWNNDKIKNGRGGAFDRPPETTWDQTTPSDLWKFEDTQVFGSNFYPDRADRHQTTAASRCTPRAATRRWCWTRTASGATASSSSTRPPPSTQYKLDGNWFINAGGTDHELKFGASYREQENDSLSSLPGERLRGPHLRGLRLRADRRGRQLPR